MNGKGKFFDNLAAMVAAGSSVKAAAGVVGCSESHAYTLSSSDAFKQRVSELRSEFTSSTVGALTRASVKAVEVLEELLGEDHDPKDRLAAAKSILGLLGPISEVNELRQRLDALERTHELRGVA